MPATETIATARTRLQHTLTLNLRPLAVLVRRWACLPAGLLLAQDMEAILEDRPLLPVVALTTGAGTTRASSTRTRPGITMIITDEASRVTTSKGPMVTTLVISTRVDMAAAVVMVGMAGEGIKAGTITLREALVVDTVAISVSRPWSDPLGFVSQVPIVPDLVYAM